jgi:hypothetical protein
MIKYELGIVSEDWKVKYLGIPCILVDRIARPLVI